MEQKSSDCYIDVWRDADFRGEMKRIYGPAEYATLEHWNNDIGSLRVGPNAFVMAYHCRDFRDELITFGPNDEVADLSQFKFDDEIESLKVIDSLKIFDRLTYNSAPDPDLSDAPDAETKSDGKPQPNPNKGRRWKGRKP